VIGSIATDEALLALKIAFLVLLYLFIWMIVRSATRDVRTAPQESIVLSAAEVDAARSKLSRSATARLTVISSPTLSAGRRLTIVEATTVGRSPDCAFRLDHDEYVSSRHAQITPADDGVWIEDLGSTNGTYANGAQVTSARLVHAGDVIRIGETELRVEP
jgi:pSer/pThr/pTyr-binding forkhead associated (FHA) protein